MVNIALNDLYSNITFKFSYYKADANYAWTTEAIEIPQYSKKVISIPKYSCLIIETTDSKYGFRFPSTAGVTQLFTGENSIEGLNKIGIAVANDIDVELG